MLIFLIFFLGLCFGSFANVVVDRLENGKSLWGRSVCEFCGYQLRWFDNIPIISFLILKAKCRKCDKKLSWQYPAVELFTGIVFVVSAWQIGIENFLGGPFVAVESFLLMIIAFLFVLVVVWDLKYMIIPNELVIAGTVVSGLILGVDFFISPCKGFGLDCSLISGFLGAVVMFGFFWILYAVSGGKWIGGGDVKLAIWLGLLVEIKMVYPALMISYIVGAIVAIFLVIRGKKGMKSQLPFGPFLILGAYVTVFFQDQVNSWLKMFFG